jgi:membrane protease YdiL (CAAX protease family)
MYGFKKGFLKDTSVFAQIFLLIAVVIFGMFVWQSLFVGFIYIKEGFNSGNIVEFVKQLNLYEFAQQLNLNENAQLLRQSFFFQTLFVFFLPALILSWLFSDDVRGHLHTEQGFSGGVAALAVLGMVFLVPFTNAVVYWTQQIPFPDSLKAVASSIAQLEEQYQQIMEMVLTTDKYLTFLTNLLIIAVFVAIGEEFLFRGVLQNIFGKVFKNPHAVIWTVGIIFSFVHFQFYGFFARAFMGVYLGYLLYYSKSIWIPVLAHFTQNAIGVIGFYSVRDPELLKEIDTVGVGSTSWAAWLSLFLFSVTFVLLIRKCKAQNFLS